MRGTAVQVCDHTAVGNGRCDNTNNMMTDGCELDGGDCCLTSCYWNCVTRQLLSQSSTGDIPYSTPTGIANQCTYMCGVQEKPNTNCPYMCLADDYADVGTGYTSWCSSSRGTATPMSSCYSTTGQIVSMLLDCIKDDASHGNLQTGSTRCGNQTGDCTIADVGGKIDGCHLHPESCTFGSCCSTAISRGWIDPSVKTFPSNCEVHASCLADPDCFSTMALCGRTNKACRGGCCMCADGEWYGTNCDRPLCWPKCKKGKCVAPNTCHCDEGYSGESCEIPVCDPACVGGQGVCISPNICECFYGWTGNQCQTPKSTPPCINGVAVAPDVCRCEPGWGGRICDYPLCQSYPTPSADCGHGVCSAPWTCECEPGWSTLVPVGTDGRGIPSLFWKGRDLTLMNLPTVPGDWRFTGSIYDQYNAFKCEEPIDCQLLFDNKCKSCSGEEGCTECISGYYLDSASGRCLRCSLRYPRCRQCDSNQCLLCDPLFVLVDRRCVSDGIFELSSDKFHVQDSDEFLEVTILRTIDSLDADWIASRPALKVTPQTETFDAVYESIHALSDFAALHEPVEFGPTDLVQSVRIPIFDNLQVDSVDKFFTVKLILDPILVGGGSGASVTTADIFIHETRTSDLKSCQIVGSPTRASIQVACNAYSSPEIIFVITSSAVESSKMVSSYTADLEGKVDLSAPPLPDPSVAATFDVVVEATNPGIVAKAFLINAVPVTGKVPDVTRFQRNINDTWHSAQEAPRWVLYNGYMRVPCVGSVPTSIGLAVAEGSLVMMDIDKSSAIPWIQRDVNLDDSDETWEPPVGPEGFCGDAGGIVCYNSTSWASVEILKINIIFKPSPLFLTRPAGVRLVSYSGDSWEVVPTECLLGGIELQGSPVRGIQNGLD